MKNILLVIALLFATSFVFAQCDHKPPPADKSAKAKKITGAKISGTTVIGAGSFRDRGVKMELTKEVLDTIKVDDKSDTIYITWRSDTEYCIHFDETQKYYDYKELTQDQKAGIARLKADLEALP